MPDLPDRATADIAFGTPFAAQVEFLRAKLALPSERWDDIQRSAHDRAFIVAGAAKADLVADLHQAITRAAETGAGLEAFRRDFKAIVAKHGWSGWTGEGTKGGEAWRTRVIYQTNMATSYAAGRHRQLTDPDYLKLRPFWRYIHSDGVLNPRPQHVAWHGLTLRHDHPFWRTHFPPNGWGCQCRITSVSVREGEASARAALDEPPEGWNRIDPKTDAPIGIDRGFDYTPGASATRPLQEFIDDKLLRLDAPIGAAMWQALKPALAQERLRTWQGLVDRSLSTGRPSGEAASVHTVAPATVRDLAARGIALESSAVWMRDHELLHALREAKAQRGAELPEAVWRELPTRLDAAAPYLDTRDQALVYAFDLDERLGKVVVRVNFNQKGRFDGARARLVSNWVVTGGKIDAADIRAGQYIALQER